MHARTNADGVSGGVRVRSAETICGEGARDTHSSHSCSSFAPSRMTMKAFWTLLADRLSRVQAMSGALQNGSRDCGRVRNP